MNLIFKKIFLVLLIALSSIAYAQNHAYEWDNSSDYLALKKDGEVLWQLNYSNCKDKPYFYPLNTVSGLNLLGVPKAGHTWHTGLFFQWKYMQELSDSNQLIGEKTLYWEPNGKGRTAFTIEDIKLNKDFSAVVKLKLEYFVGNLDTKTPLNSDSNLIDLVEHRILNISTPDADGTYSITWDMTFSSQKNIRFTAEPPEKFKGVGGYAGISARFALAFKNAQLFNILGDENKAIMSKKSSAIACNLEGLDGKKGSLIMLDCPKNDRYPSSNYAVSARDKGGKFIFLSFADVYNNPRDLKKGEKLRLQYRTIVKNGFVDKDSLNNMQNAFNN